MKTNPFSHSFKILTFNAFLYISKTTRTNFFQISSTSSSGLFPQKKGGAGEQRFHVKTTQIPDDHKLVSFDVKSLFTSIPLQLALDCTENAIKNSTVELPLPKDDIMDLLNPCLTSTYFQYNDKHYKQLHGTAMGSPVSVVVEEIVMQNIEEQALATYTRTVPLWLRYVDDTFTAVHKDGIHDFHEHLNRQNADI